MIRRVIINLIFVFLLGSFLQAADKGGLILTLPVGARAAAMGEAYSSVGDDMSALYYNPAGLGKIKNIAANYNFMSYIFEQKYHNIAGAYKYKGIGVFGLGLSLLGEEGFKLTDEAGETETVVDSSSWYINTGYCYELNKNIFVGANLQYIIESYYIGSECITSSGLGLGIGALTEGLLIRNLALSLVVKNIGFKNSYENGTESNLPVEIVVGGKYNIQYVKPFLYIIKGLIVSTDMVLNQYEQSGLRIGSEINIAELPTDINGYFRFGFKIPSPVKGHFLSGMNTGLGIKWKNYGLDYAFNYSGDEIGFIHYITLGMNFN